MLELGTDPFVRYKWFPGFWIIAQRVSGMKLHLMQKLPTPYNDVFFEALHKDADIDMMVYYLWQTTWRRPWKSELAKGYQKKYMQLRVGVDWDLLKTAWIDRHSFFFVVDWGHLASLTLLLARMVRKAPVSIWVDTPQEHIPRPFPKGPIRRTFLRWLLPKIDVIFATGRPAMRVLEEMGASSSQLVDLPYFVDLDKPLTIKDETASLNKARALRERVNVASDGVLFTINGTIEFKKKAQDLGLRAFAQCCQYTERSVGLLIAGEGPDRAALEELAQKLGIAEKVAFLGWQEPHEMELVYLASDVVVHPAHYDPFPLVILEAMSWGRTVIGSDACGSVEERIVHGQNGFVFQSGNLNQLSACMAHVVADRGLLHKTSVAARQTAEAWPVERGVDIVKRQMLRYLSGRSWMQVRAS